MNYRCTVCIFDISGKKGDYTYLEKNAFFFLTQMPKNLRRRKPQVDVVKHPARHCFEYNQEFFLEGFMSCKQFCNSRLVHAIQHLYLLIYKSLCLYRFFGKRDLLWGTGKIVLSVLRTKTIRCSFTEGVECSGFLKTKEQNPLQFLQIYKHHLRQVKQLNIIFKCSR